MALAFVGEARLMGALACLLLFWSGPVAAVPQATQNARPSDATSDRLLTLKNDSSKLVLALGLVGRLERLGEVELDKDGHTYDPDDLLNAQVRVGLDYRHTFQKFIWLDVDYEHDLYTGIPWGGESPDVLSEPPSPSGGEMQLRRANLAIRLGYVELKGGYTMSHWGLGLIANDGAHGWTPGSAYFGDPRSGDRVLRGQVLFGPFTSHKIVAVLAYDSVVGDDILIGDDEATQFVGALVYGAGASRTVGVYGAYRSITHPDGRETTATALDVYGKWTQTLSKNYTLETAAEFVTVVGKTELGPNPNFPEHDLLQFGFLSRTSVNAKRWGSVLDILYASGDQNFDDDQTNAFQVDPNLEFGVLLYRHVLTAISARIPITAGDPDLVGYPAQDLERLLTRGSANNTMAVFPRIWWAPIPSFEVYGGPLFAFTAVELADPLNSRLNGGVPRNPYDADGGEYLGTELDLGIRSRFNLAKTILTLGLEAAYFTPGSALERRAGGPIDPVAGGRFILSYDL
ncbi:MAG: hypothetical protein VX589_21160 [Myxococcota bacterium]|nr:hypothetical protein [Myxococcota bacterium]